MKNFDKDYIKRTRRNSRNEELEYHLKPVNKTKIHKSKKEYKRKRFIDYELE